MQSWILYFDGLCEPNPGGRMCWAWVLDCGPGGGAASGGDTRGPAAGNTNNVAEYFALGVGLRVVLDRAAAAVGRHGPSAFPGVTVRGDSKLVVCQVNGRWGVNADNLRRLHGRCVELIGDIGRTAGIPPLVVWVPRDENQIADGICREAYRKAEGRMPPERHAAPAA